MRWKKGESWPWRKTHQCPTFSVSTNGEGIELIEVMDEEGLLSLGYPKKEPIPDHYACTRKGEWLVYEVKEKDHISDAVEQLESGVDIICGVLNRRVDILGIVVGTFGNSQGWKNRNGYLTPSAGLHENPYKIKGIKVMVQDGGR